MFCVHQYSSPRAVAILFRKVIYARLNKIHVLRWGWICNDVSLAALGDERCFHLAITHCHVFVFFFDYWGCYLVRSIV